MIILKKTSLETAKGTWFPYSEIVEFKIRPLTKEIMRELRKKATTGYKMVSRGSGSGREEIVDPKLLDPLLMDYLLEDFKGLGFFKKEEYSPDGSIVEGAVPNQDVNLENKTQVFEDLNYNEFIWNNAKSGNQEEDQIKNS